MKRTIAILLALLMTVSLAPMASAETAPVEIVAYMMGDKPTDCDIVMEKVNEILLEKLNCTLSMNFIGWADWGTAYQLLLTGGDKIDLIYNASWASDKEYARKGAFMDLTDIVEEAAPELWEMIPVEAWDYATISTDSGDILYCIPTAYVTYTGGGIIYREDLRKQFNLPVPDSIENMTAYQKGIKENCPEMYANMDGGTNSHEVTMLDHLRLSYNADAGMVIGDTRDGSEPSWAKCEKYITPGNEAFKEELRIAKEWADADFWDKNLATNPSDDVNGYFEQGMVAVTYNGQNVDKWSGIVARAAENHPDWEIGFVPYGLKQGYYFQSSPTQDATAIPITAQHPEKALQVVQEVYTNPELMHLISYGIEGVHYTVDPDTGAYVAAEASPRFGTFAMNTWAWKRVDFMLEGGASATDVIIAAMRDKLAAATPVLPSAFSFDKSPVETEIASYNAVVTQYLTPLRYGLTNDIDADLNKFFEEAEKAGLSKIQDEFIRQYTAFCEENGIK